MALLYTTGGELWGFKGLKTLLLCFFSLPPPSDRTVSSQLLLSPRLYSYNMGFNPLNLEAHVNAFFHKLPRCFVTAVETLTKTSSHKMGEQARARARVKDPS